MSWTGVHPWDPDMGEITAGDVLAALPTLLNFQYLLDGLRVLRVLRDRGMYDSHLSTLSSTY